MALPIPVKTSLQRLKDVAIQKTIDTINDPLNSVLSFLNNYLSVTGTPNSNGIATLNVASTMNVNGSIYATGGYKYMVGPYTIAGNALAASQTNAGILVPSYNSGGVIGTAGQEWDPIFAGSIVGFSVSSTYGTVITGGTIFFSIAQNGVNLVSSATLTSTSGNYSQAFARGKYPFGAKTPSGSNYTNIKYTTNAAYTGAAPWFSIFFMVQEN